MSDNSSNNSNTPETSSVLSVSGGVSVNAAHDVNVHGDVVGRDKIVNIAGDNIAGNKIIVQTGGGAYLGGDLTVSPGATFAGRDINQYFGQQFTPPAGVTSKIGDFHTEYARFFVGRQTELSNLDGWLKSDVPFAIVAAPAGWGKSALLANWVDRLKQESAINVVYHPISIRFITNARKEILANLLSQLTKFYRRDKPIENWDPEYLENQLGEVLKDPDTITSPVLVILDGLDEIAESPQRYLRLPNQIAPNVRLLISLRTDDEPRDLRDWLAYLNWTPTVYRRIDLGQLSLTDLEDVPRQLGLSVEPNLRKQLVEALYWLSDKGDALTLALYLGKIQDDLSNGKSVTAEYADSLRRGSPGLGAYLIDTLKYLKDTAGSFQPMLDVLSIALGPVAERDFNAVGVLLPDSLDTFVARTRHLVVRTTEGRCSFSHSRIRETYKKRHMADARCKEICDKFIQHGTEVIQQLQQGSPPEEVPAYILRHYSAHLCESAPVSFDRLDDLLSEAWMTAHILAPDGYDGFLSDVARARDIAEQQETGDDLARSLGIQLKCAMCSTSVASITGNLPPSFPAALVLDGTWENDRAIGYANHVPDQIQKLRTWLALLKVPADKIAPQRRYLVNSILDTLERLDKSHEVLCARVLIDLTLHLQPGDFLLSEIQKLARDLPSPAWRARVLAHMLPLASTADEQIQLLAEVLRACSEMSPFDDDQKRLSPYTLEAVVEHMPAGTLAPALALAFPEQEYPDRKGALLEGLARHMTKKLADEFLQVCVDTEWSSSHYRAATLIHLAPVLPSDSLKSAARYIVELAKRERYRDFNSSTFHDMPSIGLLILARHVPVLDEETKREILALARGSMPLDVAAQQAIYQEILALARWCIRRDVDSFYCRHYDKALQTLESLFGLGVGEVSDEEAARRFRTNEIELDQLDFDVFCLLGPLSAASVATKYAELYRFQGEFIRKSPYFLSALATRLANRELGLVLKLGADDVETWGCLRALAAVADRLLPEHREAAIQYAIANGGYTDDSKTAALAAFGSYLSTEQVLDIVNRSIRWSDHSAPWSLLGNIIKRLDNDVRKEAAIKLKEKLNRAYDLNSAESMVVLTANHPDKEWREQIWQTVINRADLIDDLSARWSVIERLGAHTRDNQHRRLWRSQLLAQTRSALDPSLPLSYRLSQLESSLPYLPFTQRVREVYKLLASHQTETSASLSHARAIGVSLWAAVMTSNNLRIVRCLIGGLTVGIIARVSRWWQALIIKFRRRRNPKSSGGDNDSLNRQGGVLD